MTNTKKCSGNNKSYNLLVLIDAELRKHDKILEKLQVEAKSNVSIILPYIIRCWHSDLPKVQEILGTDFGHGKRWQDKGMQLLKKIISLPLRLLGFKPFTSLKQKKNWHSGMHILCLGIKEDKISR